MPETDAAYELLRELEQTLTGVRSRLADLAALAAGPPAPAAVGVPPPHELCAPSVPAPLVLPQEVDAPAVMVLPETAGEWTGEPVGRTVSAR